jgi:hypothetical protein
MILMDMFRSVVFVYGKKTFSFWDKFKILSFDALFGVLQQGLHRYDFVMRGAFTLHSIKQYNN